MQSNCVLFSSVPMTNGRLTSHHSHSQQKTKQNKKLSLLKKQEKRSPITWLRGKMRGRGSVWSTSSEKTTWWRPWKSWSFTVTCFWRASASFSPWSKSRGAPALLQCKPTSSRQTLFIGCHYFCCLLSFPPPLQSNRELDAGLQEAVSTLLWVGPRLQSDVIELKVVSTVRTWRIADACPGLSLGPVLTLSSRNFSFRWRSSYLINIARSTPSSAGQTRLEQSMTGYLLAAHEFI